MVLIMYALVRKDLTQVIAEPRAQSFMVAFLKGLYDIDYVDRCQDQNLFLLVKGKMRKNALQSINSLIVSPDAPEWIKETEVLTGAGQGDYVISTKRELSSLIQQYLLTDWLTILVHKN